MANKKHESSSSSDIVALQPHEYEMRDVLVAINKQPAVFGECVMHTLGFPKKVHVHFNDSVLHISSQNGGDVPIEHAPHCPVMLLPQPALNRSVALGVACVVEFAGNIVLTQRSEKLRSFPNMFVLPGGHVEYGESMETAVLREIQEEIGLSRSELVSLKTLGVWESTFPHRHTIGPVTHHHIVVYFHALYRGDHSQFQRLQLQTNEIQSIAVLSREQVQGLIANPDAQEKHIPRMKPIIHASDGGQENHAWDRTAPVSNERELISTQWLTNHITAGTVFAMKQWVLQALPAKL